MFTRITGWIVWAVMVGIFGSLAGDLFAADETEALALSKTLAQVKLFHGLTDAERDALKTAVTLRRSSAGERIIEQGKILDSMFIILKGKAEVWVGKKRVATFSESEQSLVGEIEFLDQLPASADVFLPQESDLIELNFAALNVLMEKQPRLGYVLMREIAEIEARRLRDTNPK